MEREFDMSEIEMETENENNPPIEKLLTGEVVKGVDPKTGAEPTAELEGDEYVKYPDNKVQKVAGPTHEKGGVDMSIPDGTKVVSKTITLTSNQVKGLKKMYDLDVSTKDSYAKAIDKYTSKIGLSKLNKEQEDLIIELKKQLSNTTQSEGDMRVNQEYITQKIYKIEQKKQEKEVERASFFDRIFDMQETEKPTDNTGDTFKYGGVSYKAFNKIASKFGISPEQAKEIVSGIKIPVYEDGGKFKASKRENQFSKETVEEQKANEKVYGTDKDPAVIIKNLYRNFPDIVVNDEVFGQYIDKDKLRETGEIVFKKNLPLNKQQDAVLKFQERADSRMKATANDILKNREMFDEGTYKLAEDYLKNETFSGKKVSTASVAERVRSYDKMMGNFTSGRYSLGLDLINPDEKKELESIGITTVNQINDAILGSLSPETQDRINKLKKVKGENSDFFLDTYGTPADPEQPAPAVEQVDTYVKPDPTAGLRDFVDLEGRKKEYPRLFYTPDQSGLAPSPQEPETMITNRFQRVDPIRLGVEQQIQENQNSMQFVSRQLENLPSSQRASALASLLANSQNTLNQSIVQTNQINAQNESQAELFNIGQADREDQARGNNLLNYEARSLRAKAITEENLRNWFDRNKKVQLNNFQTQQNLNLMDSLFPDFDINYMGTGVDYAPSYNWQVSGGYDSLNVDLTPEEVNQKLANGEISKQEYNSYKKQKEKSAFAEFMIKNR